MTVDHRDAPQLVSSGVSLSTFLAIAVLIGLILRELYGVDEGSLRLARRMNLR
jgi:hypothetical protein